MSIRAFIAERNVYEVNEVIKDRAYERFYGKCKVKPLLYTAGGTLSNPLRADNSTGMFFVRIYAITR